MQTSIKSRLNYIEPQINELNPPIVSIPYLVDIITRTLQILFGKTKRFWTLPIWRCSIFRGSAEYMIISSVSTVSYWYYSIKLSDSELPRYENAPFFVNLPNPWLLCTYCRSSARYYSVKLNVPKHLRYENAPFFVNHTILIFVDTYRSSSYQNPEPWNNKYVLTLLLEYFLTVLACVRLPPHFFIHFAPNNSKIARDLEIFLFLF